MNFLARTLEHSIASHSPLAPAERPEVRRREIGDIPNPLKRVPVQIVNELVGKHPQGAERILDLLARHRHMNYLGLGADTTVYRQGDKVVKVFRRTAGLSTEEKRTFMLASAQRERIARTWLGPVCIGQEYREELHPFGSHPVVVARQPYVEGGSVQFFACGSQELDRSATAAYLASGEQAGKVLVDFLDRATSLHDEYRLMPDLNGVDNFRIANTDHNLALIDPVPVAQCEWPGVYDNILRQVEVLRDFVVRVA